MPKLSNILPCIRCLTRRGCYCRGLCKTCFDTPGVRDEYPVRRSSRMNTAGCGLYVNGEVRPGGRQMPEPTSARPGSEEKIRVLCHRANMGQSLWHPDDETCAVKRPDPSRLDTKLSKGLRREDDDGEGV